VLMTALVWAAVARGACPGGQNITGAERAE
jgi:hypothetical protein